MDVRKVLLGITLSLLLTSGVAFSADYNKGLKAAQLGDFETALAEWAPLAESGNSAAQANLGMIYEFGKEVLKNNKTVVKWHTLAAKQGNIDSQFNLGVIYTGGALENANKAVKWYTSAAEQGVVDAQYNPGVMYEDGKGVLANDKTAVKWYTLASEQGDASAQNNLGIMYEKGRGVLTDTKRGYMWYSIASYTGNDFGTKNKDKITGKMTLSQIDKAQEMSRKFLSSGYTDC